MTALYRDRQYLKIIAGLLVETGQFDAVTTTGPPEDRGQTAEYLKLAGLELAGFKEETWASEPTGPSYLRTVQYLLYLHVRDPDPDARDDEIDRLAQLAANAVVAQELGGESVFQATTLARGQYQAAVAPERRLKIAGEFQYVLESPSDRNADPVS